MEDCSEEEVLRSLVCRVRTHCDETVKRAHQMQRLSPEIWEGLMSLGWKTLVGDTESRNDLPACRRVGVPELDMMAPVFTNDTLVISCWGIYL